MKGVFVRPTRTADVEVLDAWRRKYLDADLELPKNLNSEGVKTVIGMKQDQLITSLTGIKAIICDPLIRDPNADPTDVLFSLIKMETVLTHWGMEGGAVDSYIAIPRQLGKYVRLLGNYGYSPTVQGCVVLRRPLLPDFIPLLGVERDKLRQQMQEADDAAASDDTPPTSLE